MLPINYQFVPPAHFASVERASLLFMTDHSQQIALDAQTLPDSMKEKEVHTSNYKTADEAQIRELIETWAKSVRARDIEGIMAHHAHDILLFDVPPPVQLRGIHEYRKSWEHFFPWFGESGLFEISELNITAGDEVAFCHGLIRCSATDASPDKVELVVRLTICCRKIHGQWTVVHEHHSEPSGG